MLGWLVGWSQILPRLDVALPVDAGLATATAATVGDKSGGVVGGRGGGSKILFRGRGLVPSMSLLQIKVGGAPCVVEEQPAADPWVLVFRQSAEHGYFGANELSRNAGDPTSPMYACAFAPEDD